MARGRSDGEETKRRITDKAKQLFIQKGYAAVTMNEVCEAAAVSKGSLYHHFSSKDELLLQVSEEDAEQWIAEWDRIRQRLTTTEEQLYALAEHYANDFQNPLVKALEEFSRSRVITDDVFERLLKVSENTSLACRDVLREGMEQGELIAGDLDRLVIIVSSVFEGLSKLYYIDNRETAEKQIWVSEFYRDAVNLLLNGIRAK
ncbi:TetR/AcrR family transcriptional regulator [Cohnella abietis]|uniref:TetR family transcriptional regulator n=1 Tax=Cohnella abietis TaxID=2507935 RepID=A0A3T1CZV0_9BACL|nr:TetR/AcrR family transcriptional regulator [Cohnella abietis]BBI31364.1 TetR family transcriptional regulator [Cohnella abietis]